MKNNLFVLTFFLLISFYIQSSDRYYVYCYLDRFSPAGICYTLDLRSDKPILSQEAFSAKEEAMLFLRNKKNEQQGKSKQEMNTYYHQLVMTRKGLVQSQNQNQSQHKGTKTSYYDLEEELAWEENFLKWKKIEKPTYKKDIDLETLIKKLKKSMDASLRTTGFVHAMQDQVELKVIR